MTKRLGLVNGGMGGLGEPICTKMADQGYEVVATYSPGNKTAGEWLTGMKKRGYAFHGYAADVSDFNSCAACVQKVQAEVGAVDVLVNNAGITRDMTFKKMTKADWDAVIHTNLNSEFNSTKQGANAKGNACWGA